MQRREKKVVEDINFKLKQIVPIEKKGGSTQAAPLGIQRGSVCRFLTEKIKLRNKGRERRKRVIEAKEVPRQNNGHRGDAGGRSPIRLPPPRKKKKKSKLNYPPRGRGRMVAMTAKERAKPWHKRKKEKKKKPRRGEKKREEEASFFSFLQEKETGPRKDRGSVSCFASVRKERKRARQKGEAMPREGGRCLL